MSPEMLSVSVLRSLAELDRFIPEWREFLSTRAGEHDFFQDPLVVGRVAASQASTIDLCIVVIREGDERPAVTCIAPCYVETRRFELRFSLFPLVGWRARRLQMFGDRLVFARGIDPGPRIARVFEALVRSGVEFDYAYLQSLEVATPLWRYFSACGKSTAGLHVDMTRTSEKIHRLVLQDTYQEYAAGMGGKTRNTLKRRRDKLAAAVGGRLELVRITTPEQVRGFLDAVDRIYPRTWQAATFGVRPRNGAADVTVLEGIAEGGWLRSYLLVGGGEPVAFVVGYQYDGVYHFEEPGYDARWSALAPGTVLNHLMIADLFGWNPPRVLDFGFGDNQYKRVFGNQESDVCSMHLAHSLGWRTILRLQRDLDAIEEAVRTVLRRLGLDEHARRLVRKNPARVSPCPQEAN